MTNEQYKGILLDEFEDWQEVLELAQKISLKYHNATIKQDVKSY